MKSSWTCYGDESVAAADDAVDGTDSLQSVVITPMSSASAERFWYADEPPMNDESDSVAIDTERSIETSSNDVAISVAVNSVDEIHSLQSIVITPLSPASAARYWYADEPSLNDTVTMVTECRRDTHSSDESVADADGTVDGTDTLQPVVITPMSPASAAHNGNLFEDYDAKSDCSHNSTNSDLTQPVSNDKSDCGIVMSSCCAGEPLTEVIRTKRRCVIHNMVTGQYCDDKCDDFDSVFRSTVDDYCDTVCTTAVQHKGLDDKCNWRLSLMGTRTGEEPYACTVRKKEYIHGDNMQRHIIMRRPTSERSHACCYCSKTFATKQQLTVHTRVHTGEKPYTCTVCRKFFSQLSHLREHMRRHTSERPYVCSYCSKTFATKQDLAVHTRVHTGEKPYVCSYCNKTFSRKSNLNVHASLHTGEKPYTCVVCRKHFSQSGNMQDHMRRHTSEKPHICSYCSKTFARKQELTIHTRVHTGEKPYTCAVCRRLFSQSCSLRVHMRRHTSEMYNNTFKTHRQLEPTERIHVGEKLVTGKLRDEPMSEHLKTHYNTQDGNDADVQRSTALNNDRKLARNASVDFIKTGYQSYNGESLGDYDSQTVGRKPQSDEMKTIAGLQYDQTECVATISCHGVKEEADETRLEAAAEQKVNYRVLGGASTSSCRQREQQSELQALSADRNHIVMRRTTNHAGDNESKCHTERIMASHLRTASESKTPNPKLDKGSNYCQRSNSLYVPKDTTGCIAKTGHSEHTVASLPKMKFETEVPRSASRCSDNEACLKRSTDRFIADHSDTEDMAYECSDCGKCFCRPSILGQHQQRYHRQNYDRP